MTMLIAALLVAAPLDLTADSSHTTAGFAVKHMMVTTVRGEFGKVESTLHFDAAAPASSTVDFKIDASSIDTRNPDRDKHIKTGDFFDTAKCPDITFKSKSIEAAGAGKYKVAGDLTMKCATHPVTLDVAFDGKPMKSPWGTQVYAASATGKIKRSEWGVSWNKALEGGGVLVSDDVDLDVQVEYVQKPAEAKAESKGEKKK